MAKHTTQLGDDGRPVTWTKARAQRRSEREIPWTAGPQTRWQKFKRSAVG